MWVNESKETDALGEVSIDRRLRFDLCDYMLAFAERNFPPLSRVQIISSLERQILKRIEVFSSVGAFVEGKCGSSF